MPTYTCEKCLKEFEKKDRYDSHLARKISCAPKKGVAEIIKEKVDEEIRKVNSTSELILPDDKKQQEVILQKFFEDLHNLLWNKAGLNPERALEHMTFFFAYRLIEIQSDSLGLPQECRWSYLTNQLNEHDTYNVLKKGCQSFQKNKVTKPFFKKPEIEKADIIYDIIHQINRIPLKALQETDTLGNIFEYMLGRGMSTMSDEGQYFTNRVICRLAFKLSYDIKKTLRRPDGMLCTFADWFCGTGGFPAEYVKGVNEYIKDINWKNEYKSIYCQDMNLSSITTTLLNMLILTGIPFGDEHIRSSNSFTEPIIKSGPFKDTTIDYCFMNPPYGGDKTKGKEYKFAYSKGKGIDKKYLVNPDIQSIGIEDDDKVSAGVQLAMATLAPGGVCAIVLPQGFFFGASKKCVELRKKLVDEYKIHYIVDIASGSFINTGTKTSMLVFQKGMGSTENMKFIDLNEKVLVEAKLADLQGKAYSLNYKQYLTQNVAEVEGFDMVKLGDIVKPVSIKHRSIPEGNKTGKYPLISSALNVEYYMDTFDSEVPSLIFNTINADGNCSVHYYEKFSVTSNTYVLSSLNKITLQYIYYYLKTKPELLKGCFEGTTKKALSRPLLQSIEIPLPSIETQQQIVEAIDGWTQLAHQEEQNLKLLEKQVMFEVKEMGKGKPRMKLGDVCNFKRGTALSKKDFVEGNIPVIGGGIKPVGMHNIHNRDAYTILVSQSGTAGHISRYTQAVWASDCFSLHPKDCITNDYLYYSVLHLKDAIDFLKEGTAQPHVYPKTIEGLEINVPDIKEQNELKGDFDEIGHKNEKIVYYKVKAQEAITRLIPGAK
jgi:type I restriction-modification system DNA methylase subunit/restriction endonuclease S subunit